MKSELRSALMSRIRSKNTSPELAVRKLTYALGYRYRLHKADLPGKPDLVFAKQRKAIFVHGCFWHAHNCGRGFRPKTNVDFWIKKLERNRERDVSVQEQLAQLGWAVLIIWECEIKEPTSLAEKISSFLSESLSPTHQVSSQVENG